MMGKWAGAVCILCASWGMGVWLAAQWKGRLKALEELRRMVYFLKGEITYGHEALEEALRRVGRRAGSPLGRIFESAAEGIAGRQGESFAGIWDGVLLREKKKVPVLKEEDWEQLRGLGEHLGYLDVDMQERTLVLYLEQLDLSIEFLRAHGRERCRLYTTLGAAGGMFLVLILL